ncbi:MAG TPA: hypothetical protein VGU90_16495 [Terriglobales bacterium]|nr:hypothetical protein [Terriglobales bacterium]
MSDSNSNSSESHSPGERISTVETSVATSELNEDQALSLLKTSDINANTLAEVARNPATLKRRKVMLALVSHSRTPRHISIPLLRRMFTFDLMQVTLTPAVAADIKRAAEEQILLRSESLSLGEKISLARRGPGRVAAALLNENDTRVVSVALDNARLLEASVVRAIMKPDAAQLVYDLVSEHPKWSQRREVQIALLRSEKTPLERAKEFALHFSPEFLQEIVPEGRRSEFFSDLE